MNAYTTKEELALLQSTRLSHPEHYAFARSGRRSILATVIDRVAAYFERQRVMAELSELTDRELTDIGLTRADLPVVFAPRLTGRR